MENLLPMGEPAPAFSLLDLEGKRYTLPDYRGQVLILNFWSAECPWSARADELYTSKLAALAPAAAVLSIASNINEPPDELRQAGGQRGVSPILVDSDHAIADLYSAQTTPHYFVIDQDGVLRFQGAPDNASFRQREVTEEYLMAAVKTVLAGGDPDPNWALPYGCTIMRNPTVQ